jgi:hypothetical protein
MADVLVNLFVVAPSDEQLEHWLTLLEGFPSIPVRYLEKLQQNAANQDALRTRPAIVTRLNALLKRHKIAPVHLQPDITIYGEDIPF